MKLPRWTHKLYAKLMGYFWLPCPICDQDFGGHERNLGQLMETANMGKVVCSECRTKAAELNRVAFPDIWREDDARLLDGSKWE